MHLVIFGLTLSSSWGNGHATLWRGLLKALAARGDTAVFYERDVPYYAETRDGWEPPPGITLRLYEDFSNVRREAERALLDADAGMVTSYCPDGPAAADLLRASGTLKIFYDLDTPVTLRALERGESVAYLPAEGLRGFDLVLSYTGGRALVELQTRLGAERVAPLYGWVDPEHHHPAPPMDVFRGALSYLGTYAADRQAAVEKLFLGPAAVLASERFVMGGAAYPDDFPWTPNLFFVRHLPPSLHCEFFSSCRATLNVTREAMAAYGYCPSGRLFEAAACGAPILTDTWEGLDTFFVPGREIVAVESSRDVLDALAMGDRELQEIATAGRERTLSQHTAAHRAEELMHLLEGAHLQEPACARA
jgi:spore maturation protein CgeB